MSLAWIIYFAGVCENIGVFLCVAWALGLLVAGVCGFCYAVSDGEAEIRKIVRTALIVVAITAPIDALVPEKNTIYAMVAVSIGQQLADAPITKGIAADTLRAVQLWINKQLTEEKKK